MTDFRRFPKSETRQLIDYNRFASLTGTKLLICLDKGVIEIARYLLNTRGSWRTTYVKNYVGTIGYEMPTEAEFNEVLHAIAESNEDMSSCTEIAEAINNLGVTLSSTSSSSGCGCVVDSGTDITDLGDQESEDVPSGSEFPPGFSDRPEYDVYRCKAATHIVDGYIGTLRNWGGLTGVVGGLTVAIMVGLLLLTVPPLGLSIILGALGSLAIIDLGLFATLTLIADCLDDQREDLICQVYNSETAEGAVTVIQGAAAACIDDLDLGALASTFQLITDNLISVEQANVLVTKSGEVDAGPSGDCSLCGNPLMFFGLTKCTPEFSDGAGHLFEGIPITVTSCNGNTFGDIRAVCEAESTEPVNVNRNVTFTVVEANGQDFYLTIYDEGVAQPAVTYTAAELDGLQVECNIFNLTRPNPSDTTEFIVTVMAETIP